MVDFMKNKSKWFSVIAISLVLLIATVVFYAIDITRNSRNDGLRTEVILNNDQLEIGNKLPIPALLEDKDPTEEKQSLI